MIIEWSGGEPQGAAMGEKIAKRIVIALGLGVLLGAIFDDNALGMALALALVFGTGMLAGGK